MASNEPTRLMGNKARAVALIVLGVLAMGDAALLLALHRPKPPATPAPVPQPAAPASTAANNVAPQFDVVRVDAQGNVVMAGRAAPDAMVTILDNGAVLGRVKADSQGAFVLVPDAPLAPGAHDITLSEALPNGDKLVGVQTAEVSVPQGGGAALAVLSGPGGSRVLSGQGPKPGTLGLGTVDYDAKGHALFTGTAPAGADVVLRLDGHELGKMTAGADGRWQILADTPAQSGELSASATLHGKVLPAVRAPFALETLPRALAEGHVIITPGDNLWLIARHVYGHGTMYTLIYAANAGKIHNPNLIFPGQAFVLPNPKAH